MSADSHARVGGGVSWTREKFQKSRIECWRGLDQAWLVANPDNPLEFIMEISCHAHCRFISWRLQLLWVNRANPRVGRVSSFSPVVGIGTPPTSHPQASMPPSPRFWGEEHTGEKRVGRVPIPTRGHTLWYSLYIRTLWGQCILFSVVFTPFPPSHHGSAVFGPYLSSLYS